MTPLPGDCAIRLQRAVGQLSLSGGHATPRVTLCQEPLPVLSPLLRGQGAKEFGKGCNHGIVCYYAVAQKHCPEKERVCVVPTATMTIPTIFAFAYAVAPGWSTFARHVASLSRQRACSAVNVEYDFPLTRPLLARLCRRRAVRPFPLSLHQPHISALLQPTSHRTCKRRSSRRGARSKARGSRSPFSLRT